jgi:two-component system LytT family response regulator
MNRRILIVDDEELARVRIRRFLEAQASALEIREAADGFEALEVIPGFHPDLIFLDIEMPELSGFDVLHHLENRPFAIIFQTAFDEFAVRAFEENACDYLLKPFSDERLAKALAKASGSAPAPGQWKSLDARLASERKFLERIVVSIGPRRSKLIDHREVLCFLSESHVTRAVLEKTDYAYDYSLTHLEERLDPSLFLRIHRNAIINTRGVVGLRSGPVPTVTLRNGMELKISRDRRAQVREVLKAQ